MNKIEVAVLNESHGNPSGMMMFLAKLTQRGHNISNMDDLINLYCKTVAKHSDCKELVGLPHGTIKRFTPITVAIVGASRRFLAQARTHQVGFNYVSASLQYSDYSGKADFVVPYAIMEKDEEFFSTFGGIKKAYTGMYLESCQASMGIYKTLADEIDNDTAGYAAPQGLRNILIIQANHEAWMNFIRSRACNRNTTETQYVTMRIWEELLKTNDGEEMFRYAGPDCCYGHCREGKLCCHEALSGYVGISKTICDTNLPRLIIESKWPLLIGGTNYDF